jgi:hypothetical protein
MSKLTLIKLKKKLLFDLQDVYTDSVILKKMQGSVHPERANFWMELSAFSYQPSAKSLF